MNKRMQILLIVVIIVLLFLIRAEYNRQFSEISELELENQILQARLDKVQTKIYDLKFQVAIVKNIDSLQRQTTENGNFQFYVENVGLFEGISDEE